MIRLINNTVILFKSSPQLLQSLNFSPSIQLSVTPRDHSNMPSFNARIYCQSVSRHPTMSLTMILSPRSVYEVACMFYVRYPWCTSIFIVPRSTNTTIKNRLLTLYIYFQVLARRRRHITASLTAPVRRPSTGVTRTSTTRTQTGCNSYLTSLSVLSLQNTLLYL